VAVGRSIAHIGDGSGLDRRSEVTKIPAVYKIARYIVLWTGWIAIFAGVCYTSFIDGIAFMHAELGAPEANWGAAKFLTGVFLTIGATAAILVWWRILSTGVEQNDEKTDA
jgi:hypothetical protein